MEKAEIQKLLIEAKGQKAYYRRKYLNSLWDFGEAKYREWSAKVDYLEELLQDK